MIQKDRSPSIDALRGWVMIIMAIDHARDFFTVTGGNPSLANSPTILSFTRWITHFCAPTFFFLAGMAARLRLAKSGDKRDVQHFLFTRGLWVIFLELTLVNFAWTFSVHYERLSGAVLWALGWSMIFLAALIFCSEFVIAAFSVIMIFAHNFLDRFSASNMGSWGILWKIFHERGTLIDQPGHLLKVLYPLIPWIGVMAIGYVFGSIWLSSKRKRAQLCFSWGTGLLVAFAVIRAINGYGNPLPWSFQNDAIHTVFSFLDCQKYPPSLDFLLMTLGGTFCGLALFEKFPSLCIRPFMVFGSVPLFYYVLHLYLLHFMAVVSGADASEEGFSLGDTYLAWAIALIVLYPLCAWYSKVKKRSKNPWLSYL